MKTNEHIPVLLKETIEALDPRPGDFVVDATGGRGSHAIAFWEKIAPTGTLLIIDRDFDAIEYLNKKFDTLKRSYPNQILCVHGNFSALNKWISDFGNNKKPDIIFADLGVSSPQLDNADRGFSFSKDGPLDMRMNRVSNEDISAFELVNTFEEEKLSKIFFEYGEEPKARFVARAIVEARKKNPIFRTGDLAEIVKSAVHYNKASKKNPATKVFQAIRIAVNDEMGEIRMLLDSAFTHLNSNGRLGIISFHSLEDRLVKHFMVPKTVGLSFEERQGRLESDAELEKLFPAKAAIRKPFPIVAGDLELAQNPRARSAKLRVMVKK